MDFQVVAEARHSPTVCFICRESEGPFVHVHAIEFTDVATANGRETVEGDVYVCIGRDIMHAERPDEVAERKIGCARTLGRLAGCATPDELDGWHATISAYQVRLTELEAREQELLVDLAEERAKPNLVSADDLLAKIAGTPAAE